MIDEHRYVLGELAERFPQTFFLIGSERRPLKIGIYHDVRAVTPDIPDKDLKLALRIYTRSIGYLSNVREGAARIDLSGQPAGIISADEELHSIKTLFGIEAATAAEIQLMKEQRQEARRQRQQHQQARIDKIRTHQPAEKPEPATAPAPKRLGLSDLKRAWQERQAK